MLVLSSLLAVAALAGSHPSHPDSAAARVTIDSARHEVIITTTPFDLQNEPPMDETMMDHGMMHDTPVMHFTWPVQGWFRGFSFELHDAQGRPVPQSVMHHMIMVNFSRRQLVYNAFERILGAGTETSAASVPKTIGVPMDPGMDLGMYIAWHNSTGHDLKGVVLTLRMQYTPANQYPRPVNALPIYMDVNLTVGGTNMFDVPPGRSEKAHEFTLPISGRLLGVGGHMHDYGVEVRLEDVATGKVLTRVTATKDSTGHTLKVSRQLFGVGGRGLKLEANHPYRVVGVYDNPTGHTLINGAMAHMVGLFVPDDMSQWPKLDMSDSTLQADLKSLQDENAAMDHMDMDHMDMDHDSMPGMDHGATHDSTKAPPK